MNEKKLDECKKCHQLIRYEETDTWVDYSCIGYDIKLVMCPTCGNIHVLGHREDTNLDVNNDMRFYF